MACIVPNTDQNVNEFKHLALSFLSFLHPLFLHHIRCFLHAFFDTASGYENAHIRPQFAPWQAYCEGLPLRCV